MTKTVSQAVAKFNADLMFRGFDPFQNGATPANTLWRSILLKAPIDEASLPTDPVQIMGHFVSRQALPGNGFTGALGPYTIGETTCDSSTGYYRAPIDDETFTASGGPITFHGYLHIRGNKGIPPQSCTLSGQTFTANDHGYIDDDLVTIFVGEGGSLPGGYTDSMVVEVHSATQNTFEIRQINNAAIVLTGGGNSLFVGDASGLPATWENLPAPQTLTEGEEQKLSIYGYGDGEEVN